MTSIVLVLAGAFAFSGLILTSAEAASPAYCALYAREYAIQTVAATGASESVHPAVESQAYYRCLNADEEPPLPRPLAYTGGPASADAGSIGRSPAPDETLGVRPSLPASDDAAVASIGTASASAAPVYRGSGLPPWTPEWAAWCAKYFPRSWDPKTGTVVHGSSTTGERVLCR
jgi:hypothetical protein